MKGIQSNGFLPIIAQAIAEMEELHGEFASINEINLAELGRRTGISQAKLRRLKANGFCETPHGPMGQPKEHLLDGYTIGRKGYSGPMDALPVVSGKYPRQLSKSISKTKDDASLRTGLFPPPKGSGKSPNYVGGVFYEKSIAVRCLRDP